MFESWFDQQRDLEALQSVLAVGQADAIADSVIGPAYIAAAALVHDVLGLSPEDSLVALTRAVVRPGRAGGVLLVRVLVVACVSAAARLARRAARLRRRSSSRPGRGTGRMSRGATSSRRSSPSRCTPCGSCPRELTLVSAAVVGALLALLALTRSFELVALVARMGNRARRARGCCGCRAARAWARARRVRRGAFLVTTAAVYLATGKRDLFFLYAGSLDRQSGNIPGPRSPRHRRSASGSCPRSSSSSSSSPATTRCARSRTTRAARRCRRSSRATQGTSASGACRSRCSCPRSSSCRSVCSRCRARRLGGSERAAASSAARDPAPGRDDDRVDGHRARLHGEHADRARHICGTASPAISSCRRSSPASSQSAGLRRALARCSPPDRRAAAFTRVRVRHPRLRRVGVSRRRARVRACNGIPRIESRQLGAGRVHGELPATRCDVSIAATTTSGRPISIPEASTLTFGCGSDARVSRSTRRDRRRCPARRSRARSAARCRLADGHGPSARELRARRREGPRTPRAAGARRTRTAGRSRSQVRR